MPGEIAPRNPARKTPGAAERGEGGGERNPAENTSFRERSPPGEIE